MTDPKKYAQFQMQDRSGVGMLKNESTADNWNGSFWQRFFSSPMALLCIGIFFVLLSFGGLIQAFEAIYHPEKAAERHRADMERKLNQMYQLHMQAGHNVTFEEFRAGHMMVDTLDYSKSAPEDKRDGIIAFFIGGGVGFIALRRRRSIKRSVRAASTTLPLPPRGPVPPPLPPAVAPNLVVHPQMPPPVIEPRAESFDLLSLTDAAKMLGVSEDDVLKSILAGDLKVKKIGEAYRISRAALEEFVKVG